MGAFSQSTKKKGGAFSSLQSKSSGGAFSPKKIDTSTNDGLQQLAEQSGLKSQAQRIVSSKGESPKKIFSGGFISDTFDVLNALQYGTAGVLQGKGFAEGVRSRASFADKDQLGKFGVLGTIAGIGIDIATDPLTYVGGLGLLTKAGKAIKASSAVKGAVTAAAKVPVLKKTGEQLGRMFIYRFGQDPVYKEIAERSIRQTAIRQQNMVDLVRPITKLDASVQREIADFRKAGKLDELPPELLAKAKPAFDELDRLGKEAVDAGLLSKQVYEENVGRYMARLYKTKEIPDGAVNKIKTAFGVKPQRIDLARFKARKDIPDEVREAMGEILEAGYPTAKSLVQLTAAVEKARFFKTVATKWGADEVAEGLTKLADTPAMGALRGKAVPSAIADDLEELTRPRDYGFVAKAVAGFKFGKVVMNPATHARNIVSNFILNDFAGLSPARVDIYAKAAKEMATKGKWYQEARQVGLGVDSFAAREIKDILTGPESNSIIKKLGKPAIDKISDLYQKEEEFAKLAQFIFQRGKGLDPEAAWKAAETATFNYAQVTPFIRRLRESAFGFPFITFTYKATPQVAKTLLTKPGKISKYGKIKNAIENSTDQKELERERASEPDWIRDGFYVKLPMKDKLGRSSYLDLTYILPFGDLMSGQLVERTTDRNTGLPEGVPSALLKKAPLLGLLRELGKNQDFYGNKIWQDSDDTDQQLGDLMRHLVKFYAPPLAGDFVPGGYDRRGERRKGTITRVREAEEAARTGQPTGYEGRTAVQEFMKNFGMKIQPIDVDTQESFMEDDIRKALETLLIENQQGAEFSKFYVPKN